MFHHLTVRDSGLFVQRSRGFILCVFVMLKVCRCSKRSSGTKHAHCKIKDPFSPEKVEEEVGIPDEQPYQVREASQAMPPMMTLQEQLLQVGGNREKQEAKESTKEDNGPQVKQWQAEHQVAGGAE
jgi:hypothetical protein